MPRPPKNQEAPCAAQRMQDAFWDALSEAPYGRITVSDIVKRAGVNRNAFYYHYEGIEALARASVTALLAAGPARLLVVGFDSREGASDVRRRFVAYLSDPDHRILLARMCLLAGANSPQALRLMLEDAIVQIWCDVFGVGLKDIGEDGMFTLRFVYGGVIRVLGEFGPDGVQESIVRMMELEVAAAAMQSVVHVFEEARERVHCGM